MSGDAPVLADGNTLPRRGLNRVAEFVACTSPAGRWLLALLGGAIAVLAMPPFGLWPLLFISFALLVWLLDGACADGMGASSNKTPVKTASIMRRGWRGSLIGLAFGFAFFLGSLHWIGQAFLVDAQTYGALMPFAVAGLSLFLALFPALALGLSALFWRPQSVLRMLVLALFWSVIEWLRGHVLTGFPWNAMGYAYASSDALMQLASLIGLYGQTFCVVLIAAAPAMLFSPGGDGKTGIDRAGMTVCLTALALLSLIWAGGAFRLFYARIAYVPDVHLRIVQPAIDQKLKWEPDQAYDIFEQYMTLTGGDGLARVTHVIWPESALPFYLDESKPALERLSWLLPQETVLITGALRRETDARGIRRYYNSIQLFNSTGGKVGEYDKFHLVPFGEYVPWRSLLARVGFRQLTQSHGAFTPGSGPQTLNIPGAPSAGPLVCYEAIFPGAVALNEARPGWLVNVTNDGWFGDSLGPPQHLVQARLRAVEEGLPLVRAANTGISAVIDPYGRVLSQLGINRPGVIDSPLPKALRATVYARWGDTIFWLLAGGVGLVILFSRSRRCHNREMLFHIS
jgi:apolipoprotein N-acyltransferase